ncbi:MAG: Gfo/Idh/MocA family oxidoreductase [Phenylobacterium sp.]
MSGSPPVRVGVLGCAQIVKAVAIDPARHDGAIVVVAVGSRDAGRARAYAAEHGVPRAHGDYQAVIDDPEVEVVYNPLPNSLHAEWTLRALAAGKAVLCEKPLASNADEARRMADAAESASLPLIEAFHYVHHPVWRLIEATLRSGEIGRPLRLHATLKLARERMKADNIRWKAELGGGATMDLGAYAINALRRCVGEEPQVLEALADLHGPGVDRAMRARLGFPGGADATFEASLSDDGGYASGLRIEGERGVLTCDNPFLPRAGTMVVTESGAGRQMVRFDEPPTYTFQARALKAVIRDGAPVLTPGSDGIANMAVIDAVYRKAGLDPRATETAQ